MPTSIAPLLTVISQTPQPTPLPFAFSPETGFVVGKTTTVEVRDRVGPPENPYSLGLGGTWHYLKDAKSPGLDYIIFDKEIVSEIHIYLAGSVTTGQVVEENGGPEEMVFINPPPQSGAPRPTPVESLIYASRGFQFRFWCKVRPEENCLAVSKQWQVYDKVYQIPMPIGDRLAKIMASATTVAAYEIKAWSGFLD